MRIKDIAVKIGVSPATVSRTLRQPELVTPETRERVMKVVEELNFRPSRLAGSLRRGLSGNIVVILPDITNPYFSALVRGIEKHAKSCGYSVLLGDTRENVEVERSFADMVFSRQADGLIICSQRLPFDIDENSALSEQLPPIVSTADIVPHDEVHKVVVDNVAIGKEGMEHLIELGHERIAILAGTPTHQSSSDRLIGVKQALEKAGRKLDDTPIYHTDFSTEEGVKGAKELAARRHRPTAIFCFGDQLAFGAMHGLIKLGYRIPDDISIIGVDDVAMARYSIPALTTIAQPTELIGERCMATLLSLINKEMVEQRQQTIPHQLVVRESTASPK